MPIMETERLILRDFTPADWDAINAITSDPGVIRYTHFARWGEAKRRAWLARMVAEAHDPARRNYSRAITLRSNGTLIGWFYIGGDDSSERGVGYALSPAYWGWDSMPEAAVAIFAYEFATLGTQRIVAECDTANIASARVMQKCGMTYVKTTYDQDFEGTWGERHHYAIDRRDWR
jgi:RimJ/RimL family protein N-acetyltransferase